VLPLAYVPLCELPEECFLRTTMQTTTRSAITTRMDTTTGMTTVASDTTEDVS
ncbi:hypothetical protein IscW_ISCW016849, partial [Ixodes scapularis]